MRLRSRNNPAPMLTATTRRIQYQLRNSVPARRITTAPPSAAATASTSWWSSKCAVDRRRARARSSESDLGKLRVRCLILSLDYAIPPCPHSLGPRLKDQHAVAVREESILLCNRVAVGRKRKLPAGEGRHQNQQARLRQVEVGQQRAGAPEGEAGRNEKVGFALRRIAFDGAHAGGPDGDDPRGSAHGAHRFVRDREALRVQLHVREDFRVERLKRSQAHV